jgi:hypothetical protein
VQRWRERRWDRRQIRVALAEAGETCILRARKVMLPVVRRLVHRGICFGRHRSADARFIDMSTLESLPNVLRERFRGARVALLPVGHPDD